MEELFKDINMTLEECYEDYIKDHIITICKNGDVFYRCFEL